MAEAGVYMIQSKIKPERIYIGSSRSIKERQFSHFSALRRKKHGSIKLQNHYNKYGESDLTFKVLVGCEEDEVINHEQFFLDLYKPWFNVRLRAETNVGIKRTPEQNKRNSESKKGIPKPKGEKWLKAMEGKRGHNKGWKASAEFIERNRQWHLGRKLSEETKNKMRIAQLKRVYSDDHRQKCIEVWVERKRKKQLEHDSSFK